MRVCRHTPSSVDYDRCAGGSHRIPCATRFAGEGSFCKSHYSERAHQRQTCYRSGTVKSPEITPYSKSRLSHLPQFSGQHAEDLYWSTYRPGQYFGMSLVLPMKQLPFFQLIDMRLHAARHANKESKVSAGRDDVV